MSSPEQLRGGAETAAEAQRAAAERSEQLKGRFESVGEQSPETKAERVDSARKETKEVFAKEAGKERKGAESSSGGAIRRTTKAEKKASYAKTMRLIRTEMSAPSRVFSKIIHAPFIEKSSEVLGSSLARPNAILAGSFTALILVSLTYVVARTYGYVLSGFETIGAFGLGWILGIIFDYVKVMSTGKR